MTVLDRRSFLARGGATAGGAVLGSQALAALTSAARGQAPPPPARSPLARKRLVPGGYGPLERRADQRGVEVLALPAGFRYVTFSRTGEPMSDGTTVPRNHDGMAALPGGPGLVRLIRNQENRNSPGDPAMAVGEPAGPGTKYDPLAGGGTVSLDVDPLAVIRGDADGMARDFVTLNGTTVNCAGGVAPGESGWLTCEETVAGIEEGFERPHGYVFPVPVEAEGPTSTEPYRAMGRFAHEAVVVDPRTGFVYETEDSGNDSGFYRFRPAEPGRLDRGGTLEMLAVADRPGYSAITGQREGEALPVAWVPIGDPDPDLEGGDAEVAAQGIGAGGAVFNRLEGIWYDRRGSAIFFNSTSGGDAGFGQVWRYDPFFETLTLFFESTGGSVLDSPDNLLVTPRGGIILCEDDATGRDDDTHPLAPGIVDVNRLIGLTARGEAFELAVNVLNDSELAGACFSPDGRFLFGNVFGDETPGSGMTCAIWGPWARGAL